jgi:hypothetical protein
MNPYLKFFEIIPSWVYALLLAGALALVGIGKGQNIALKLELVNAKSATTKAVNERDKLVSDHALAVSKLQAKHAEEVSEAQTKHAKTQQEIVNDFTTKTKDLVLARRNAELDAGRVRDQIRTFTAGDLGATKANPASCGTQTDRLKIVGELLAEGFELVEQSKTIIEQRDAEVKLLQASNSNDRLTCERLTNN